MDYRQIGCFADFTDAQVDRVDALAETQTYAAGETVFQIDDPSEAFYLLVSGSLQVEIPMPDGEDVISILHPVALFGEVGLLAEGLRSATVTAKEPVRVRRIRNADFLDLLAAHPEMAAPFYRALARNLYRRVARTTERMAFYKIALSFQG